MKELTRLAAIGLAVCTMAGAVGLVETGTAGAQTKRGSGTEYIIGFESGVGEYRARAQAAALDARSGEWLGPLGALVVETDSPHAAEFMAMAARQGSVAYIEPNLRDKVQSEPDDPWYSSTQWAPQIIGAPEAWSITHGHSSVKVAVLDTGLNMGHEDWAGKSTAGYDFVNSDSDPADDHGHGTFVAGIVGAATNNGKGVASIGRDVMVMPVKVADNTGYSSFSWQASGITWATDNGAKIINMSMGGTFASTTVHNAVKYAHDRGVLIVAGAGNNNSSTPFYPAAFPEVIGVGATTSSDARWTSSNFGNWLSLVAPGASVHSTTMAGGYGAGSGTSFSAPHVAAVAGLVWSANSSLTRNQVRNILESTAVDLGDAGFDDYYGHGRVDAGAAVAAAGSSSPPPTATPAQVVEEPTPTATAAPTEEPVAPAPSAFELLANAAGPNYLDTFGRTWQADQAWNGTWGYTGGSVKTTTKAVAGTNDDPLYQRYRDNPGEYRVAVANGDYEVELRFAEFEATRASQRQMNVIIEGRTVESSLSVYGLVGPSTALNRVHQVTVSDGVLNIAFSKAGGPMNPMVSAIRVTRLDSSAASVDPTATLAPAEPTATNTLVPTTEPLPTATPTDPPAPTATTEPGGAVAGGVHVADLAKSSSSSGPNWTGTVTIRVHDASGQPLAGAKVRGAWSGGHTGTVECTTDSTGRCSVTTPGLAKKVASATYTVGDIVTSAGPYSPTDNYDLDGDSNGTTITIAKP